MLELYEPYSNNLFPFVNFPVSAGDPLENDAPVEWLSLDDYISKNNQRKILYVRVGGTSMQDLGITDGSIVAVDRDKKAENGSTVLARLGSAYLIKKWSEIEPFTKRQKFYLVPANKKYKKRIVKADEDFEILGVVTHCLVKF
jgi:SOS-response transcriptional repressor LexA